MSAPVYSVQSEEEVEVAQASHSAGSLELDVAMSGVSVVVSAIIIMSQYFVT